MKIACFIQSCDPHSSGYDCTSLEVVVPRFLLPLPALLIALLTLPASAAPETQPSTQPATAVVDLLKLDNPLNLVLTGWTIREGALTSNASATCRVEFAYVPPAEYDYRVVFIRNSGTGGIVCVCRGGGHQFVWRMSGQPGTKSGFALIAGKGFGQNATSQSGSWLHTGQQQELLIQVRRDSVEALLDGKSICLLQTDFHDLSLAQMFQQQRDDTIGLVTINSDITIESAEVTELSGPDKPLK